MWVHLQLTFVSLQWLEPVGLGGFCCLLFCLVFFSPQIREYSIIFFGKNSYSCREKEAMFAISQHWSIFFYASGQRDLSLERLRDLKSDAVSSPCLPTHFPLLLTHGAVIASSSVWLDGQVKHWHRSVCEGTYHLIFAAERALLFLLPLVLSRVAQSKLGFCLGHTVTATRPGFLQVWMGRERAGNGPSRNHSRGDSEDKVTNVAPV